MMTTLFVSQDARGFICQSKWFEMTSFFVKINEDASSSVTKPPKNGDEPKLQWWQKAFFPKFIVRLVKNSDLDKCLICFEGAMNVTPHPPKGKKWFKRYQNDWFAQANFDLWTAAINSLFLLTQPVNKTQGLNRKWHLPIEA